VYSAAAALKNLPNFKKFRDQRQLPWSVAMEMIKTHLKRTKFQYLARNSMKIDKNYQLPSGSLRSILRLQWGIKFLGKN
jgi:hypothetical protein